MRRSILALCLLASACTGRTFLIDDEASEASGGEASSSSPTTSTTTNDESDSDEDDAASDEASSSVTTSGFLPDYEPVSCGEECDIWSPDDCPEGQKCTAAACEVGGTAWDSNVCREIQGDAGLGEDCEYTDGSGVSGNDTCAAGYMCWGSDPDTGLGTCLAFATGSPDSWMCPPGYFLSVAGNGVLPICLPGCDPIAQDCSGGDLCLPSPGGDGYLCVLNASGDRHPYGSPCNYANACNSGMICISADDVPEPECASAGSCCSPYCLLSEPNTCPGTGQVCDPVFEWQPPGYEDVGVCRIPN